MKTRPLAAALLAPLLLLSQLSGAAEPETPNPWNPTPQEAEKTYDESYVGILGLSGFAYRGKYLEPLALADFYQAVDRPDLAAVVKSRERWNKGVAVGALSALGLTSLAMFGGLAGMETGRMDLNQSVNLLLGGALVLPLIPVAMLPFVKDEDPVDLPTKRRLADEHDQRLRESLGLPVSDASDAEPSAAPPRLLGGISLLPGGGAVTVGVSF